METKICTNCKKEFEKTEKNFFRKAIFWVKKNGEKVYGSKLTATCRPCHSELITKRNREKRCKELGCDLKEYRKEYYKQIAISKTKLPHIKDKKEYKYILRKIRQGYKFTIMEQYYIDKENTKVEKFLKMRKVDYPECKKVSDLPKEIFNKCKNEYNNRVLTDGVVSNRMGLKISECPPELIENKRLIIKLNQILNVL